MSVRRLLLTTDAVGGVWTYTVELARALQPLGVEPVMAVVGPSPSAEQRAETQGMRLLDTGLPLDWLAEGPSAIRRAGTALSAYATAERVDAVQLHSAALAADVPFEMPVLAVQHSCVATWWEQVRRGPLPREFAWRRDCTEDGLNRVDAVVAPTAAFAAQTMRTYGLCRAVQAVHNGRQPIALPTRPRDEFVLTVGRLWDAGKNVQVLDRAAAQVELAVEAIGPLEGPDGTRVSFANLRTPGSLSGAEIAKRLAGRPIFASAALYEPFGLSALEAAQAGCALVLSDIATFRELWDGAAIFVEPDDARGFATAINMLAADPESRERLGQAAQLRALRYTPDAMARGMIAIYDQLASAATTQPQAAFAGAA